MLLMIRVIFILIICLNYRKVTCETNHTVVASVFIDEMTNAYFDLEEKLWFLIGLKNQSDLVQNILKEHKLFSLNVFSRGFIKDQNYDYRYKLFLVKTLDSYPNERQEIIDRICADHVKYSNDISKTYSHTLEENVFEHINKAITAASDCSSSLMEIKHINLLIYHQYSRAVLSLLESYYFVQMSYMILTQYGHSDYTLSSAIIRSRFKGYYKTIQSLAIDSMSTAEGRHWMCDNPSSRKFAEVTNFVQDYIENEVNFNEESSCSKTCSDYTLTKEYECYDGTSCHFSGEKRRCQGTINSCTNIESPLQICPDKVHYRTRNVELERPLGRYYYNTKEQIGQRSCDNGFEISSWIRWLEFAECSFCRCQCFNDDAHKYFSLQPVLSDQSQNKVVTGVALAKRNRTFYWTIAQGTMYQNGVIVNNFGWVPVSELNSNNVHDGYDYHMLSWQNRSIALDTLMVPTGSVITGIRFKTDSGRLHFEIQATKFDFATGKLYDSFEWIASKPDMQRVHINLDNCDLPEKARTTSKPMWEQNLLVEFQSTDAKKDTFQRTIPYIDTQKVQPGLAALVGIGLYYKNSDGFGGSIAPYVVPYDYLRHIVDGKMKF